MYNKFNGSVIEYNGYEIIGWRAKDKTVDRGPIYPYITMDLDWSYDEFAGLLVIDGDVAYYQRFIHGDDISSEDIRLYVKPNGKLYMMYIGCIDCDPKASTNAGVWEIEVTPERRKAVGPYNRGFKLFGKNVKNVYEAKGMFGSEKKLLCETVDDKNSLSLYKIYKNWSYIDGTSKYMDGHGNLTLLNYENDVAVCSRDITNIKIESFIQNDWGMTLTTPTLEHMGNMYGVAHVRIKWELLSENFSKLDKNLRNMIRKFDVHHNDCYFMSIYRIKCDKQDKIACIKEFKNWTFTKPFLISDFADDHFSYNINFPCGLRIKNGNMLITYGLGDCILLESELKLEKDGFKKRVF